MHKKFIPEMGLYYKRIMDIEHCLKNKLSFCLYNTYKEKTHKILNNYFLRISNNPQRSQKYKNKLKQFIKNEKITETELNEILSFMYFSDVADILTLQAEFLNSKAKKITKHNTQYPKLCDATLCTTSDCMPETSVTHL